MSISKDKCEEEIGDFLISDRGYIYIQDRKWPYKLIETHHVVVQSSHAIGLFMCISIVILVTNLLYLFLVKEKSVIVHLWSFFISAVLFRLMLRKRVLKESIVIIPAFGVQLETHYVNGRIIRRFVPIDKILKPVLLERVNPITCYWTLSLVLIDEEELMLVFEELHPPVKMLVHIWKALCMASEIEDSLDSFAEHTQQ